MEAVNTFKGFCLIEGIDGERTDDRYQNWIEILSYHLLLKGTKSYVRF
jgi:hypothetical protein